MIDMRQSRYEVRSCTTSIDHGQSVDGKVYNNLQAAQYAADAWESQYGEDCYVHEVAAQISQNPWVLGLVDKI